ncbi:mitochondrial GTPase 1 [Planococcus citri]|uniref:mitochondrial GTPase 1 n=1 Tax=Planococcus citri TaxID=170843 RepID=UPI0031FA39C2
MPVLKFPLMQEFRQKFVMTNRERLQWFPGHMSGGMKKMQQKLSRIDCIIEVHDARIPITGRNPNFKLEFLGTGKPHILVLNKMDLVNPKFYQPITDYIYASEKIDKVLFTNCKRDKSAEIKNVIPEIKKVISQSMRYNRSENREYGVMIIGVPNVGKSSLINAVRAATLNKGGATPVGARAGITKSVLTRIKISFEPPVYVYDTPGILTPKIPNVDVGMKLALCACFQDHMVGIMVIADYILYWMNRNYNHSYMDFFGIEKPCDDVYLLLAQYAIKKNMFNNRKVANNMERKPDMDLAAKDFVLAFRNGTLGPVLLDADILP